MGEMGETGERRDSINLLRGWPNVDLLPVELIKNAAVAALSKPDVAYEGLEYGDDPGFEPAREAIAAWLTSFYRPSSPIHPDRLNVTGGASQNLACVLSVYTDPEYTRNIWLVSPSYFMGFRIFEDAGFLAKMRAVPEDEEGLDVEYLRTEIARSEERALNAGNNHPKYTPARDRAKVYKHVIYCVPTFANPSSRTMSRTRREELVRIAREFDALIVPDDVYDLLQWPAEGKEGEKLDMSRAHMPRLVDIDRELDGGAERQGADGFGNAISNGSFSKLAGPGMRVGWAESTEKFAYGLSQNGATASGGAPSNLTSTYITEMLEQGQIQNHIATVLRPTYESRYKNMMRAIITHLLPLGFSRPQTDRDIVGGYFTWLGLPSGLEANSLAAHCKAEENLIIAPGELFRIPGDLESADLDGYIRLCFAYEDEAKLAEGIERLSAVARRLLDKDEAGRKDYVLVEGNMVDEAK